MKNKTTAMIFSILLGGLGVDRFYLGYTKMGVLKLLTCGCFGVLYVLDIINIITGKLLPADGSPYEDDDSVFRSSPAQAANYTQVPISATIFDDLEKIGELHERNILTDEEFKKLKDYCLAKL